MLFVPAFPLDSADEVCGDYTREQLVEMDRRFVAAVELALAKGLESRAAASATYAVKSSLNGNRHLAEEAAIGAAWNWFRDANFDVPAAAVLARCPGVSPERVCEGIRGRLFSWIGTAR